MRFLVCSGGGSKWAYEVGAVEYLCGNRETVYDGYCGTSAGALISGFMSQFSTGREKEAAVSLVELLKTIDDKKIWKRWFPFGKLHALWKSSALNSAPLQALVRTSLSHDAVRSSGKKLRVAAVSLTTGRTEIFDEGYHDLAGAVIASSSFPAMFCPIKLDGELWTDGGVKEITPLKSAIDAGATEIDVVITSPDYDVPEHDDSPNTIDVAMRTIDLMSSEILSDDVKVALMYNDMAAGGMTDKKELVIRVIRPSSVLTSDSLDFSPKSLETMRMAGYEDAKRVCES